MIWFALSPRSQSSNFLVQYSLTSLFIETSRISKMVQECVETATEMGLDVVKTTPDRLNTLIGHKYHQVKLKVFGCKVRHHAQLNASRYIFFLIINTWAPFHPNWKFENIVGSVTEGLISS